MSVRVETLKYLALASKKDRDNYLVLKGLSFLDLKSEFLKAWSESSHYSVTMLVHSCGGINGIRNLFEEGDDVKPESRWR